MGALITRRGDLTICARATEKAVLDGQGRNTRVVMDTGKDSYKVSGLLTDGVSTEDRSND